MPISYTPGNGVLFVHDQRALLVHAVIDDVLREQLWGLVTSPGGDDVLNPAVDMITTMFGLYQLPPLVLTDGVRLIQRGPIPVMINGMPLTHPGHTPWVTHDVGAIGGTLMVGQAGPWWPASSAAVPAGGFSTVLATRTAAVPPYSQATPQPVPQPVPQPISQPVPAPSPQRTPPEPEPTPAAPVTTERSAADTITGDLPQFVRQARAEASAQVSSLPVTSGPQGPDDVLAARCTSGHPTPAHGAECRVCGGPLAPGEPVWMPRPVLGTLLLPDGSRVSLERPVVLGRMPQPTEVTGPGTELLVAQGPHVSRSHLEITVDGWFVLARDLDSTEGTTVAAPGGSPERLAAMTPTPVAPGSTIDLGGDYAFRFVAEG